MRRLCYVICVCFLLSGCAVNSVSRTKANESKTKEPKTNISTLSLQDRLNNLEEKQKEMLDIMKLMLSLLSDLSSHAK